MSVSIDSSEYENSHGKLPRGRGGWLFWFGAEGSDPMDAINFNGIYSEARSEAKAAAGAMGFDIIRVAP